MRSNSEQDIRRGRLAWLPAIAAGAMCAVLVWPQTRPIVLRQLRFTVPTASATLACSPLGYDDPSVVEQARTATRQYAEAHAGDVKIRIAAATLTSLSANEHLTRLERLNTERPGNAAVLATLLRYKTMGLVRCTRDEVVIGNPGGIILQRSAKHSRPADVEAFSAECLEGEALDLDNAYFPMLRAAALYENHHDSEAAAEIRRASTCSRWDEYLLDQLDGEVALQSVAFGSPGPLARTAFGMAILLPHLNTVHSAAKVAMFEVQQDEAEGRVQEAQGMRDAIRHVGSLMRADSRNLIGSVVGTNLVALSLTRTPGNHIKSSSDILMKDADREALLNQYSAYLASINSDEMGAVRSDVEACVRARSILSRGLDYNVFDTDAVSVTGLAMADLSILCTAIWIAGMAMVASILLWVGSCGPVKRMPRAGRTLVMSLLTILLSSVTVAVLMSQTDGSAGSFARLVKHWLGPEVGQYHYAIRVAADGFMGIIAVVPTVMILTLCVLCLVWRVPIGRGVARGIRGCAVPVCSVLMLGYVVLMPITAYYEARLDANLTRSFVCEGKVLAQMVGADWPGVSR